MFGWGEHDEHDEHDEHKFKSQLFHVSRRGFHGGWSSNIQYQLSINLSPEMCFQQRPASIWSVAHCEPSLYFKHWCFQFCQMGSDGQMAGNWSEAARPCGYRMLLCWNHPPPKARGRRVQKIPLNGIDHWLGWWLVKYVQSMFLYYTYISIIIYICVNRIIPVPDMSFG
jgi:hypothetical protein